MGRDLVDTPTKRVFGLIVATVDDIGDPFPLFIVSKNWIRRFTNSRSAPNWNAFSVWAQASLDLASNREITKCTNMASTNFSPR